jgi:uncharacterized protein YcbX
VVRLHGQSVPGHLSPDPVNDWFSRLLGAPAWLLYQSDSDQRLCDADFAIVPGADQVGYADAFPFLLTAQATLDQLNLGLPAPLPMDRFRPNIVVRGTTPDAEYGWREISIGGAGLSIVKPCTRCVVTTIDQRSGRKDGVEPLAALGRDYFLRAQMGNALVQGAVFGENAIASRPGEIRVGDPVRLLSAKTPHIFGRDKVAES